MPTCTDMLMGLNLQLGKLVQKVKNDLSSHLHILENTKAHSTVAKAEQALNKCSVSFLWNLVLDVKWTLTMPIKKEFVKVLKVLEDAASSKLVTNHK